jgi:peroxiredoxin
MPSLEQLYRSRGEAGLTVLGVSVDDRLEPVRPFVDKLGLTFPIAMGQGREPSAYRATASR